MTDELLPDDTERDEWNRPAETEQERARRRLAEIRKLLADKGGKT